MVSSTGRRPVGGTGSALIGAQPSRSRTWGSPRRRARRARSSARVVGHLERLADRVGRQADAGGGEQDGAERLAGAQPVDRGRRASVAQHRQHRAVGLVLAQQDLGLLGRGEVAHGNGAPRLGRHVRRRARPRPAPRLRPVHSAISWAHVGGQRLLDGGVLDQPGHRRPVGLAVEDLQRAPSSAAARTSYGQQRLRAPARRRTSAGRCAGSRSRRASARSSGRRAARGASPPRPGAAAGRGRAAGGPSVPSPAASSATRRWCRAAPQLSQQVPALRIGGGQGPRRVREQVDRRVARSATATAGSCAPRAPGWPCAIAARTVVRSRWVVSTATPRVGAGRRSRSCGGPGRGVPEVPCRGPLGPGSAGRPSEGRRGDPPRPALDGRPVPVVTGPAADEPVEDPSPQRNAAASRRRRRRTAVLPGAEPVGKARATRRPHSRPCARVSRAGGAGDPADAEAPGGRRRSGDAAEEVQGRRAATPCRAPRCRRRAASKPARVEVGPDRAADDLAPSSAQDGGDPLGDAGGRAGGRGVARPGRAGCRPWDDAPAGSPRREPTARRGAGAGRRRRRPTAVRDQRLCVAGRGPRIACRAQGLRRDRRSGAAGVAPMHERDGCA